MARGVGQRSCLRPAPCHQLPCLRRWPARTPTCSPPPNRRGGGLLIRKKPMGRRFALVAPPGCAPGVVALLRVESTHTASFQQAGSPRPLVVVRASRNLDLHTPQPPARNPELPSSSQSLDGGESTL
eukprot:364376-Chlamydomonas_euryale.AAC.9